MTTERYCRDCGAINKQEDEHCFACGIALLAEDQTLTIEAHEAHLLRQRYRLQSQVGAGGFSAVYKAEDTTTGKIIAVKAISLRGLNAQEKIEATDAFNREVGLLSTLRHRHLPQILDHFTDTECWYVVMDFVDGTPLEKRLEQLGSSRLPLTEVIDIGIVLCNVLEYLHGQQPPIISRDLKPANIMLTPDGHLFLIDFGIARHFKPGKAKDTIPFGSPGYAAPEQYGKTQTTTRADIYSLGVVLHQLLYYFSCFIGVFSLTPSILAIHFGHIGKRRAKNNVHPHSTLDTANIGMIIGYTFGIIYLIFMLCTLSVLQMMYLP